MKKKDRSRLPWYVRAFRVMASVFSDTFMVGVGYFNSTIFPPLGLLGLILGILRLYPIFRKSRIVFAIYWFGVILTLDFTYTVVIGGLLQTKVLSILIITLLYFFLLFLRRRFNLFRYLTAVQLLVFPIFLFGFFVKSGELFSARDKCLDINNKPGMRVVTNRRYNHSQIPHTAIPRYFVYRPRLNDMLVCDHIYVYEDNVPVKNCINRMDLRTGMMKPWLKKGEVLAISEEKETGRIYAIVQRNYISRSAPNVELFIFDTGGKIIERKDFKIPRTHFIGGTLIIFPDKVFCHVENYLFEYNKKTHSLHRMNFAGWPDTPIYRVAWSPPYIYGTYATTLIYYFIHKQIHAIKINTDTSRLEAKGSDSPFGYYDIAKIPGRELFAVSRNTREGGYILDSKLRKVRSIGIPPGVREIEVTRDGKYLLAAGFLHGYFFVIDIATSKVVASEYVGSGARGLMVADDGTVLIGASCGVVAIDLDKFLAAKRKSRK